MEKDSGLTKEELDIVKESWATVYDKSKWKTNGMEYWVRLLTKHPSIQSFFKSFDNFGPDELRKSPKLRAHVITFGHGLASFMDNLDDVETLTFMVQKLVANHLRRKIDTLEIYQEAFTAFLDFMKESYSLEERTVEAWTKTVGILGGIIDEHLKTLKEEIGTKI